MCPWSSPYSGADSNGQGSLSELALGRNTHIPIVGALKKVPTIQPLCKPYLLGHPLVQGYAKCPAPTVAAPWFLPSTPDPRVTIAWTPGCFPPDTGALCAHSEGLVSFLPTYREVTFWVTPSISPGQARPKGCSSQEHKAPELGGRRSIMATLAFFAGLTQLHLLGVGLFVIVEIQRV